MCRKSYIFKTQRYKDEKLEFETSNPYPYYDILLQRYRFMYYIYTDRVSVADIYWDLLVDNQTNSGVSER